MALSLGMALAVEAHLQEKKSSKQVRNVVFQLSFSARQDHFHFHFHFLFFSFIVILNVYFQYRVSTFKPVMLESKSKNPCAKVTSQSTNKKDE